MKAKKSTKKATIYSRGPGSSWYQKRWAGRKTSEKKATGVHHVVHHILRKIGLKK